MVDLDRGYLIVFNSFVTTVVLTNSVMNGYDLDYDSNSTRLLLTPHGVNYGG